MASDFQLFLYTIDEYRRFANHLPVKQPNSLSDDYSEADYIGVQVRLMLLRKYYGSSIKENVNFKRLVTEAQATFPNDAARFQALSDEFDKIESQQILHLLADGTKLDLYATIEDTIYGLYLHADANKITHLENTAEAIRFFCVRKYIFEIEEVIYKLYDLLTECGITLQIKTVQNVAPMVYLGDPSQNTQTVKASPYWSNLYGHDATDEDMAIIDQETTLEEKKILALCIMFADELKEQKLDVKKLRKYVHPAAWGGWGDFTKARELLLSIPKPGFSTRVRYNDARDTAYVRIFPNVDEAFCMNTPHVFSVGYEFALGKWFGKWRIYQFGGHLDSIYEKRK